MSITRKRNRAGKLIKKPVLNTQQIVSAPLELKNLAEPAMKKMQSEIKTLNYVKKERKEDNIVNDLKNGTFKGDNSYLQGLILGTMEANIPMFRVDLQARLRNQTKVPKRQIHYCLWAKWKTTVLCYEGKLLHLIHYFYYFGQTELNMKFIALKDWL